ncbi:helix-turn-helix transcriptional regulator [Pseudonocardia kujensis]|uniref:winged helix-turn-helix transcriptional regulator n=1 Tax=Pseudonocardia kujensis TaxID=1128675 RepID=UPI001E431C4C|nr:helix-turn-helix transcriptional regulator [Pseudonocardia kujensis]
MTQKSLTKALRRLERDGLVDRRVHATVPPRVEYRLTGLGREVGPLLGGIDDWAKRNADTVVAARTSFDAATRADVVSEWTSRG